MTRPMRRMAPVLPGLAMLAMTVMAGGRPAAAWEDKGHTLINRLAAEEMPAETPAFFKNAVERLAYLGPEPDRWKVDSGPQLYAVNGPDHYMDMEPVMALDLPADRYKYIRLVDEKGLGAKGWPAEKLGFLPYRIAEMTQRLQSQWRDWKAARDGSAEKSQIEQDIIYTAGVLGHYVADSANPHHTTVHHNGWDVEYAPNPNGYTTSEAERARRPNGFHHRFEGAFVDAAIDARDVRPLMAPVKPVSRIFDEAVAFMKTSNGQVDRLYQLDKQNAFATTGTPEQTALRFTQERMAAGASMLRDIWASAIKGTTPFRRSRPTTEGSTTGNVGGNASPASPSINARPPEPAGARTGK